MVCNKEQHNSKFGQVAHLKDISQGENLGKGGSLAPTRNSIDDVGAEGCGIVLNVHCHLALNCHLQPPWG